MSPTSDTPPTPTDSRPAGTPRPDNGSHRGRMVIPVGGIVLVVIGIVLFVQNFGVNLPENWWAYLLLIPAIGAFATAQHRYQTAGGVFDRDVIGLVISGLIFLGLFAGFYFRIDENLFGPLVLIAIGLGILARHYWPRGG